MRDLPWGPNLPFWKSGRSEPGTWIEKTAKLISRWDGAEVLGSGYQRDPSTDVMAYVVAFTVHGASYRAVWPVLEHDERHQLAARRQAATMLYHDVKNRLLAAEVFGFRAAFMQYMALPDGRLGMQAADEDSLPKLLAP